MYLDSAASAPIRRQVLESMWPYLVPGETGIFGNPSSTHEAGARAATALEAARSSIATAFGCRASEVIFTSGGTEADNLAVKGIALGSSRGRHVVTSPIEHEAVHESVRFLQRVHGFEVTEVAVDSNGLIDPLEFASALRPDTALATIVHGHNEIGTVQPIALLAEHARRVGVPFHTDAVQSVGWERVDLAEVDALSIAGHKLGTPKGIGALIVRASIPLEPLLHGGGQERGRRSGTENVAGAVGLATALQAAPHDRERRAIAAVRDALIDGVLSRVPDSVLTGSRVHRLANHASFCFPGTHGETVLLELERRGVTCSSGSACAAGSDEPSPVLLALGIAPDVAQTAVRFTLGVDHDIEVDAVVDAVADAVAAVRGIRDRAPI